MPTIPYVKQTWTDDVSSYSGARGTVQENGIYEAHLQPAMRVFHNVDQSITTSTFTALAFNSERYDQAAGASAAQHDTATNNSRLTCLYAGIYSIKGNVAWAANATGRRGIQIRKGGTSILAYDLRATNATGTTVQAIAIDTALAVNEYVELFVFQDSGGSLNAQLVADYSCEFMMHRVG